MRITKLFILHQDITNYISVSDALISQYKRDRNMRREYRTGKVLHFIVTLVI